MNEKIEERCIYDVWCVTAKTPSGAKVMVCGKPAKKPSKKHAGPNRIQTEN